MNRKYFLVLCKILKKEVLALFKHQRTVMAEIFTQCDRVTVFRDGKYVATKKQYRNNAAR